MIRKVIIILILVVHFSAEAYCAEPLIITEDFKEITIGNFLDYYLDETNSLTIDHIINNSTHFIDNSTQLINLGYSRGSAWFRLTVDNRTQHKTTIFFEHQSAATDKIEFYIPSEKTSTRFVAGDHIPFKLWPVNNSLPSFQVAQNPGLKTYYFKVQDLGSLLFYMKAKSESTFFESNLKNAYWLGGVLATAALLVILNLFLALANRHGVFIIVNILGIFSVHHALYYEGFFIKWFWPNASGFNDLLNIEVNLLMAPVIGFFWINFSNLPRKFKIFCYSLSPITVLFTFAPLEFDYYDTTRIIYSFTMSSMLFAYIWCCFDLFRKISYANFFSIATTFFFIVSILEVLRLKVFFNYQMTPFLSNFFIFSWKLHYGYFICYCMTTIGFISFIKLGGKKTNGEHSEYQEKYFNQIKDREDIKNNFIHTITHELGTPVQGIKQMVQLLSYDDEIKKKHEGIIDIIVQATDQVFNLTNEFIDYARYENHKVRLTLEKIEIKKFVHDIIDSLSILNANNYRHEIILDFSKIPEEYTAIFDRTKIRMALINILTNAFKYTPKNGRIIIAVHKSSSGRIIFSIADNGIGISFKIINNIYEAFFQGKNYNEEIEGIGLGLTITKYAVELHGGVLKCKSPPPFKLGRKLKLSQNSKRKGSVFYISLPGKIKDDT